MAYAPAKGECGTLIVDRVPPSLASGDLITRITPDEVVIRTQRGLWVAVNQTPDILDAKEVG